MEMLNKHISCFNSVESTKNIPDKLSVLQSKGEAVFSATHVHKNGRLIPCKVNGKVIRLGEKSYIVGVVSEINISAIKKTKETCISRSGIHVAMHYSNSALLESQTELEIYNRICQIAVEYGEVKLAWVGKLDTETQHILPIVKQGKAQTYLDNIKIPVSAKQLEGHGPTAIAYREQRTVVVQDFSTAPLTLPWHERADKYGFRSSIALPIIRDGKSYAVVTFYYEQKNAFGQEAIDSMEEMVQNIGLALERL